MNDDAKNPFDAGCGCDVRTCGVDHDTLACLAANADKTIPLTADMKVDDNE